jgi:hypothetical protein
MTIHHLGGQTTFEPRLSVRGWVLATYGGPLVSLLVATTLVALRRPPLSPGATWLSTAMWVNLGWGVMNLLPVYPLDTGRLLMHRGARRWPATSLVLTTVSTALVWTLGVVFIRSFRFGILFTAVGLSSIFEFMKLHEKMARDHLDAQLGTSRRLVMSHRYAEATRVAEGILLQARDFDTRNAALTTLAWAQLGLGRTKDAMAALKSVIPQEAVDPYALAATEKASGHVDRALERLETIRKVRQLNRDEARLLIDLHAERRDFDGAVAITLDYLRVIGPEDARLVAQALECHQEFGNAATVSQAIAQLEGSH